MRRIFVILPVVIAILISVAGCKEDSEPYPTKYWAIDIVTLKSNNKALGMTFELQRNTLSEKKLLRAAQYLDTAISAGTRVLINYEAEMSDTSKNPLPITLIGLNYIPFDTVRAMSLSQIEKLEKPQLEIVSCWQSGDFVNFQINLQYDGNDRSFNLVADETTIGTSCVDCYLYNEGRPVSENYIDRRYYGSFFVGNVLSENITRQIRIFTGGIDNKNSYIDLKINPN